MHKIILTLIALLSSQSQASQAVYFSAGLAFPIAGSCVGASACCCFKRDSRDLRNDSPADKIRAGMFLGWAFGGFIGIVNAISFMHDRDEADDKCYAFQLAGSLAGTLLPCCAGLFYSGYKQWQNQPGNQVHDIEAQEIDLPEIPPAELAIIEEPSSEAHEGSVCAVCILTKEQSRIIGLTCCKNSEGECQQLCKRCIYKLIKININDNTPNPYQLRCPFCRTSLRYNGDGIEQIWDLPSENCLLVIPQQ